MANGNDSITQSLLGSSPSSFIPGDPSTIMTPEEGRALSMSAVAERGLEPLERMLYEPGHSAGLDVAQKKIADISSKQSSFMPHFIATAAALTGNFGPAMQLQEQKRKTADIQKMLPAMNEVSRMKAMGQYSDAAQALEMLSTKMGARVPELGPMFMQQQKDLSDKQTQITAARQGYKILMPHITKENPNYPAWKSLGAALDAGTPGAMDMYKTLVTERNNMQNQAGQAIATSNLLGTVTTQPLPQVYEAKNLDNYVGLNVGQAHGLDNVQMANLLNAKNVTGDDLAKQTQLRKDLIGLQDVTADLGIAGLITIEPAVQTQMLANGVHPLQVATRRIKDANVSEALKDHYTRITEQEIAKVKGTLAVDIRAPAAAGVSYYDPKTGEVNVGVAPGVAAEQGWKPIPVQDRDVIYGLSRARKNLALVNKMFDASGFEGAGAKGLIARAGVLVNRLTGLPTTSAQGTSLRALVAEAINIASNMKGIPSNEVQRLRELSTNEGAERQDTIDALNNLIYSIDEQMGQIVGKGNVPQTAPLAPELSPAMQEQREKYLKSPQAQQHQRNRAEIERLQQSGEIPMGPQKPAPSGIIPGSGRKSGRQ